MVFHTGCVADRFRASACSAVEPGHERRGEDGLFAEVQHVRPHEHAEHVIAGEAVRHAEHPHDVAEHAAGAGGVRAVQRAVRGSDRSGETARRRDTRGDSVPRRRACRSTRRSSRRRTSARVAAGHVEQTFTGRTEVLRGVDDGSPAGECIRFALHEDLIEQLHAEGRPCAGWIAAHFLRHLRESNHGHGRHGAIGQLRQAAENLLTEVRGYRLDVHVAHLGEHHDHGLPSPDQQVQKTVWALRRCSARRRRRRRSRPRGAATSMSRDT